MPTLEQVLSRLDGSLEHRAHIAAYVANASGSAGGAAAGAAGGAAAPAAGSEGEEKRFKLLMSVGEECQEPEELRKLVQSGRAFNLYDGFEPSGRMHIAQGVFKAINVNKCTAAGGTFIFWVADWFGLMNDKMGGDLTKIRRVGEYFIEVWKATGMDLANVKFEWCSDAITQSISYWDQVLDVARTSTLKRIQKCCQIMGRNEGSLSCAQILYPIMQCTDIFFLKADICQLGVDQRKVNWVANKSFEISKFKFKISKI